VKIVGRWRIQSRALQAKHRPRASRLEPRAAYTMQGRLTCVLSNTHGTRRPLADSGAVPLERQEHTSSKPSSKHTCRPESSSSSTDHAGHNGYSSRDPFANGARVSGDDEVFCTHRGGVTHHPSNQAAG
jgi:hypothetical protein